MILSAIKTVKLLQTKNLSLKKLLDQFSLNPLQSNFKLFDYLKPILVNVKRFLHPFNNQILLNQFSFSVNWFGK